MRLNGTLTTWNDDRGFGFIEPTQGGLALFVHIKAFEDRATRPHVGQVVSFEVELSPDGKKRAKRVQAVRAARLAMPRRNNSTPAQWGTASLFAIPAFALLYLAVTVVWRVPHWVAGLYLAASVVCFVAYAADKSAAVAGRWRVAGGGKHAHLARSGGWLAGCHRGAAGVAPQIQQDGVSRGVLGQCGTERMCVCGGQHPLGSCHFVALTVNIVIGL